MKLEIREREKVFGSIEVPDDWDGVVAGLNGEDEERKAHATFVRALVERGYNLRNSKNFATETADWKKLMYGGLPGTKSGGSDTAKKILADLTSGRITIEDAKARHAALKK